MKGTEIFLMLGAAGTAKKSGIGPGFSPGLSSHATEEAGDQVSFGRLIAKLTKASEANGSPSADATSAPKPSEGLFFPAVGLLEQRLEAALAKIEAGETLSAEDLEALLQALVPLLQALPLSGDEKAQMLRVFSSEDLSAGERLQALLALLQQDSLAMEAAAPPDGEAVPDLEGEEAAASPGEGEAQAESGLLQAVEGASFPEEEAKTKRASLPEAGQDAPDAQTIAGVDAQDPEEGAAVPAPSGSTLPASSSDSAQPEGPAAMSGSTLPASSSDSAQPEGPAAMSGSTLPASSSDSAQPEGLSVLSSPPEEAPAPSVPRTTKRLETPPPFEHPPVKAALVAEPDTTSVEAVTVQAVQGQLQLSEAPEPVTPVSSGPEAVTAALLAPPTAVKNEGLAKLLRRLQAEDPSKAAVVNGAETASDRGEVLSVFRRILQLVQRLVQKLSAGTDVRGPSPSKLPQGSTQREAKLLQPEPVPATISARQTPSAAAGAPKPLPQVSVEALPPRIGEEVVKFVQITRAPSTTTLKMQLVPPDLGTLNVTISQADDGVRIRFTVESREAHKVVADQLPKMAQKLESHQVVLKEVEVEVSHDQEEPFAGTPHHAFGDTSRREPDFTGKPEQENKWSRGTPLFTGLPPGGWHPTGYALGVNIYA